MAPEPVALLKVVVLLALTACRAAPAPVSQPDAGGAPPAVAASRTSGQLGPRAADPGAVASAALGIPHSVTAVDLGAHAGGGWQAAAQTGGFLTPAGAIAQPFSLALLQWDAQALYAALYAADEDLAVAKAAAGTDHFDVSVNRGGLLYAVRLGADGVAQPLAQGASWTAMPLLDVDRDGSLDDDRSGDDEEWAAFVALPWSSLGGPPVAKERLRLEIERCDASLQPRKAHRCVSWRSEVVLQP